MQRRHLLSLAALPLAAQAATVRTRVDTPLGPFVIAPHLIKNVSYDPGKDFDLISVVVQADRKSVV